MRKIKQLSLVLFIFSVLAFSYPLTQVFAQGGGQCDSNPACDPTSGTCCNQCDSNPACVTSDLNAIPCCSTNDRSGPPGDMRGDHRGDRGDHRGPPDGGDPYAKQCKDWKEKGSPAWDTHSVKHCNDGPDDHGNPPGHEGDPYAKQCEEWKQKGSPSWDTHSVEHCS